MDLSFKIQNHLISVEINCCLWTISVSPVSALLDL